MSYDKLLAIMAMKKFQYEKLHSTEMKNNSCKKNDPYYYNYLYGWLVLVCGCLLFMLLVVGCLFSVVCSLVFVVCDLLSVVFCFVVCCSAEEEEQQHHPQAN